MILLPSISPERPRRAVRGLVGWALAAMVQFRHSAETPVSRHHRLRYFASTQADCASYENAIPQAITDTQQKQKARGAVACARLTNESFAVLESNFHPEPRPPARAVPQFRRPVAEKILRQLQHFGAARNSRRRRPRWTSALLIAILTHGWSSISLFGGLLPGKRADRGRLPTAMWRSAAFNRQDGCSIAGAPAPLRADMHHSHTQPLGQLFINHGNPMRCMTIRPAPTATR